MVWLALAGWSEERSGLVQMSGGGLAGTGWLVRGRAGSSTNVWRWFGWHLLAGQRKGRVRVWPGRSRKVRTGGLRVCPLSLSAVNGKGALHSSKQLSGGRSHQRVFLVPQVLEPFGSSH